MDALKLACVCLLAGLSVSFAGAEPVEIVQRQEVAINAAIRAGTPLNLPSRIPPLSADEMAALHGLADCDSVRSPDSSVSEMKTVWRCPGDETADEALLTRQTLLRVDHKGEIFGFELNPNRIAFKATTRALQIAKGPSMVKQASTFADAIKAGGDATLQGLVPLTALQIAQLRPLENSSVRIFPPLTKAEQAEIAREYGPAMVGDEDNSRRFVLAFASRAGAGATVDLFFDEQKRPVGILVNKLRLSATVATD